MNTIILHDTDFKFEDPQAYLGLGLIPPYINFHSNIVRHPGYENVAIIDLSDITVIDNSTEGFMAIYLTFGSDKGMKNLAILNQIWLKFLEATDTFKSELQVILDKIQYEFMDIIELDENKSKITNSIDEALTKVLYRGLKMEYENPYYCKLEDFYATAITRYNIYLSEQFIVNPYFIDDEEVQRGVNFKKYEDESIFIYTRNPVYFFPHGIALNKK